MQSDLAQRRYVGRFAPSPTGPLHFGSLIAALGSYLQAKAHGGKWLLRIEDIDPPREVPGSADAILRALDAFGLAWDEPVLYQSSRLPAYREAVDRLLAAGQAYRCQCSRQQVAQMPGGIYSGQCRQARVAITASHSVRILTDRHPVRFVDGLQGNIEQSLESDGGDFIIQRRDGLFAYQLAVTLDDDYQGVTEVVRGCDLLSSTARQIHLRRLLQGPELAYLHLPVAVDASGQKLSKQTGAAALDFENCSRLLFDALMALWQAPPPELRDAPVTEQLAWAKINWTMSTLSGISTVELDQDRRLLRSGRGPVTTPQSGPQ